jgi:hypothetical protein
MPPMPGSSRALHRCRRGTAFVAALALLLAQAIGLAHAVVHPRAAPALLHAAVAYGEHDEHAHGPTGLFDAHHDEGSLQCQLLDQLTHADGLAAPSALASTFAAPVEAFAAAPAAPVRAACARGYHARGPPQRLA